MAPVIRLLALSLLLTAACGEEPPETGESDTDTDTDTDTDLDAPEITSGTVHCEGEGAPSIVADVVATDPQGTDTLATLGGRFIAEDGEATLMDEEVLVCQPDGTCQAVVVSAMHPGVDCTTAPGLVFSAVVLDVDGHSSEAAVLTWTE